MTTSNNKRMRFAIYARYSSEMQNELSLEGQETCCRQAVADRGGAVVAVYTDSARSGWSLDRDGFKRLQADAQRGRFDAVMVWKFDRLARNHDHAVMIKMLLRHEYGLKLYCVEGFSEDDDNSPYTALMEQMLACFAAFYSRNLSSETKRGKRQRAIKGEFNGSIPPFGYRLVTQSQATEQCPAGLYVEPRAAAILRRAFRLYSTGNYSHADIADWMNKRPYVQKLRAGQQPINREMVRDMLQNRVYTGRVRYTETIYKGSLGENRTTKRHRSEWFEGKHQAIITDELFEICQQVCKDATRVRHKVSTIRSYTLQDRVYCARCLARKPDNLVDDNYGKMRPNWIERDKLAYYRCIAHARGYEPCGQRYIRVEVLDQQIYEILSNLSFSDDIQARIEQAVKGRIENDANFRLMAEIEERVKRIDFSWEQGFLDPQTYAEKRRQLQREIEALRPVDYEDLNEAADLVRNFRVYWDECEKADDPADARRQLVSKILKRALVYDDKIIAVELYGGFALILEENETALGELLNAIRDGKITEDISRWNGDDGSRTRDLCLDRAVC